VNLVTYNREVASAMADGAPIVALETTILSHGMPYPHNLETAIRVERAVREEGAVPATIAVLEGVIHAGLEEGELELLARAGDVLKLSRADLAFAVSERRNGATTVAATMVCAHGARIGVFATGGIGGVHRGAESTFDVSADLYELARTPVTVVCAGVKAILDIARTLEVLETLGVPVVAYGQDAFPAFWSRDSGLRAPLRLDEPHAIAQLARTARDLGLHHGLLVAQPPPESLEIPREEIEPVIERAIAEAAQRGIAAKAVTPWLLDRVRALTGERSLRTNIALIEANARLAARIAIQDNRFDAARTRVN
jgi:pseudouridine-5'-phosphate glycosidase